MKKKDAEFKELKRLYPKTMSKDQFYRIAHDKRRPAPADANHNRRKNGNHHSRFHFFVSFAFCVE